jgi:GxxExxY protein
MDTDGHGFDGPHTELTRAIIGAAMEVANTLGHGFLEKIYENALVVELRARALAVEQQRRFDVLYKQVPVGEFIPDLIVDGAVIVDTKTIDQIGPIERGKMINYLRITRLTVGLTINFNQPKITWDRVLL